MNNERLDGRGRKEILLMSWLRSFLLGLVAVLAVGAMSAVSASADTCTGGSHVVFCTSPGNLPIVHELVLGTSGLALLAGILGGLEAKIDCSTGDIHGEIELLGDGSGVHVYLTCREEKPAGCKLSTAQESKLEASFDYRQESATLALLTGAKTGEEFVSVQIEHKSGETCSAEGTFPVTGKQRVEVPTGGAGHVEQEIVAKKALSFLKLGGSTASLSFKAEIHLGGANVGSAWLVMTGE